MRLTYYPHYHHWDEHHHCGSFVSLTIHLDHEINVFRPVAYSDALCYLYICFICNITSMCSIPGRTESFWKEIDYVKNMWKHRQELKVEDAGIAALFGLECYAWFCAGEIVGRGFTFTGYYPWNQLGENCEWIDSQSSWGKFQTAS